MAHHVALPDGFGDQLEDMARRVEQMLDPDRHPLAAAAEAILISGKLRRLARWPLR